MQLAANCTPRTQEPKSSISRIGHKQRRALKRELGAVLCCALHGASSSSSIGLEHTAA